MRILYFYFYFYLSNEHGRPSALARMDSEERREKKTDLSPVPHAHRALQLDAPQVDDTRQAKVQAIIPAAVLAIAAVVVDAPLGWRLQ